jgi:hypothetical protein
MCDYSLMCYQTRLAVEGEDLVLHRFPSGSKGLASPADLNRRSSVRRSLWAELKEFFGDPYASSIPAVCIPPSSRLIVRDIDKQMQQQYGLRSEEMVVFTELTQAVNTYRDALVFDNGRQIRLQQLPEGLRVTVLDLRSEEPAVSSVERPEAQSETVPS